MQTELLPLALQELIGELSRLPGIGRKTATRLALHILNTNSEEAEALARAIHDVQKKIHFCARCFNFTEDNLCPVCRDDSRNQQQICVVEDPSSIMMIENTHEYRGVYHVLGGVISPLDGIGPEELRVRELTARLADAEEVILALNPSTEGETTSIYLSRLIKPLGIKITRLARGIPLGSSLEFVDELTLSRALQSRDEI